MPLRNSMARKLNISTTIVRRGPNSPERMSSRALIKAGSQRRVCSIDSSVFVFSQAAIMRSASASVVAMGFSQSMARGEP